MFSSSIRPSVQGVRQFSGGSEAQDWAGLKLQVGQRARELGLGPVRVTSAVPSHSLEHFQDWLRLGYHGEMDFMAREDRLARRKDLNVILPGVQSVLGFSLVYWPGKSGFPLAHIEDIPLLTRRHRMQLRKRRAATEDEASWQAPRGIVSSYSWGKDYHDVLGEALQEIAEWLDSETGGQSKVFVDTGAILERDMAARAGLGFIGKNTMLIHPKLGSGFFIGEILTTAPIPADLIPVSMPRTDPSDTNRPFMEPPTEILESSEGSVETIDDASLGRRQSRSRRPRRPGCGTCTRCLDACPTQAFVQPYVLDARRCISYLTIELKTRIPNALRPLMGSRIYGCDVCQLVCPWNSLDWSPEDIPETPIGPLPPPVDTEDAYSWIPGGLPGETENDAEHDGEPSPPPLLAPSDPDSGVWSGKSPMFGRLPSRVTTPDLLQLIGVCLEESRFRAQFQGTPIFRIGPLRMLRNIMVALGNTPLPAPGTAEGRCGKPGAADGLKNALRAVRVTGEILWRANSEEVKELRGLRAELQDVEDREQRDAGDGTWVHPKEQSRRRKLRNRLKQSIQRMERTLRTRAMVIEHADWAREQLILRSRIHRRKRTSSERL